MKWRGSEGQFTGVLRSCHNVQQILRQASGHYKRQSRVEVVRVTIVYKRLQSLDVQAIEAMFFEVSGLKIQQAQSH